MNALLNWLRPMRNNVRHERKSGLSPLVALHGLGQASWSPGRQASLAREGYARNPVVYRCVRLIAEAAATLPWLLYEGDDEIADHPALELLVQPNDRQAGQVFLEVLYCHLLVSGNAYVQLLSLGDEPRELHLLRPDRVEIKPDEAGWPAAYEYSTGTSKTVLPVGQNKPPLLHLGLFNPLDDVRGQPPLAPAHMALDIHNTASQWNKALLDNSARPSGALVYLAGDGANLTEEQFTRLKQELEEGYSGATSAGRPMLLEGGLDWKAMGLSPRDMDFMQAKNGAARDIALAFGVPPMLLGIPGDNTYANYREANIALWRQTVLPLASRVAGMFSGWLSAHFGGPLRLCHDRDAIEALSVDREALWKRINEAEFLTDDEKREAVGYGPAANGQKRRDGR